MISDLISERTGKDAYCETEKLQLMSDIEESSENLTLSQMLMQEYNIKDVATTKLFYENMNWVNGFLNAPFSFESVVMLKHVNLYRDFARRAAQESYCVRRKVGAAVVTKNRGVFIGYNGMPSGFPNVCELEDGTTDPRVIHAEANAFDKMQDEGVATKGSIVFLTDSPCIECAKRLYGANVGAVIYENEYRIMDGVDFLNDAGIDTFMLIDNTLWYDYNTELGVYEKSCELGD